MSIRKFSELVFLCEQSGLKTVAQVIEYMQKRGINADQLYDELDARLFPAWRVV